MVSPLWWMSAGPKKNGDELALSEKQDDVQNRPALTRIVLVFPTLSVEIA